MKENIKIAILDMYNGFNNEGMRCIKMICGQFLAQEGIKGKYDIFDVRKKNEIPEIEEYDIFISTGGPGNPLPEGHEWEAKFGNFIDQIFLHNQTQENKKYLFLICHSFQIACNHLHLGIVCKRRSTSFGVMPIHRTSDGENEPFFNGLPEIFYAVDSRDYQLIQPNWEKINQFGAKVLCLEKIRNYVPLERAIMAIRFSDEVFGTQFHPEADAEGMLRYFKQEEKMIAVVSEHGVEKYEEMIERLDDPDKIMLTESIVIPSFLNHAAEQILAVA
ncbi:GMP synthase - glutamine amidotransferase domain-like protein [Emticicia oligotrophica DSM 17448]|uniref:GMP synthase-glutamine amidotransferase domain-like protein n=1 Tax=Emticicia oligotrophica (strain DSM 17448 / CIP 109782 / MTCC 6937 / GPTSA100-15) TaxID=929562 RepID=A0ABM5N6N1_EMTOG|nr:GMP synthase [Emticicia oligotrophica]AFK05195.1 GMP synthase - glutamine amidotransferase domain-like protein [Emticicia oligotrophica DSM 17448]